MKGSITLNSKEQRMNDIIVKLIAKEITISQAGKLTGLSERQIYRKKKNYLENGIYSIPHQLKYHPSKKGYRKELKDKIVNLYKEEYFGWNFHHFNDELEDVYNIKVSDTFIYKLLTKNNIKSPYKLKKKKTPHPPRPRRENAGELIQVDASKHKWFYGDDNYYYLHGAIDDATETVTGCFFANQETIYGYQMVLKDTIMDYGIPECLYTDYRTIFKSTKREVSLEEELSGKEIKNTKFANMLDYIGIDIISTTDPRSKGRIERLWRTFQDRLYKELKKNNINTIEKANQYIKDVFLPKYNARFASEIDYSKNSFISVDEKFDYNKELAVWSEYHVHHNCYLKINGIYYLIMKNGEKASINTKRSVKVYTFMDGTNNIYFNEEWYTLKPIKKIEIEINKNYEKNILSSEEKYEMLKKASKNSPWRKWNPNWL